MGILERMSTIIRANLNDVLTRAEDPEKIINQTLMDMREAQYEARMEVTRAIAEGKKLERDFQTNQKEAGNWLEKAEQALKSDREDLAREALKRKNTSQDLAGGLKEQLEAHQGMVERLKTQLRALDAKIDEAERKRQLLIARQRRAEAQESVNSALSKTDTRAAFEAFDRMEGKIVSMEDRLSAQEELEAERSLDDEFAELSLDADVEEELSNLKAKLSDANA